VHIRYMPTLEWSALILAKRGGRSGHRLTSWRVMINEHAQKLRVKHGYYTDFRLVGRVGSIPRESIRTSMSPTRWGLRLQAPDVNNGPPTRCDPRS
jgi:hypothetical protein